MKSEGSASTANFAIAQKTISHHNQVITASIQFVARWLFNGFVLGRGRDTYATTKKRVAKNDMCGANSSFKVAD